MRTYFDIETGPLSDEELTAITPPFDPTEVKCGNLKDPDKIAAKLKEAETNRLRDVRDKAALDALTGRVLAIGLDDQHSKSCIAEAGEAETLGEFWLRYKCSTGYFVGFNIFGFDLPFLIKRSLKHSIKIPGDVRRGRYWGDRFIDLRDIWQCGDRKAKGSLDTICKFLGIEGKNGNGKDFARLFELNREKALEYLENDLRMTRQVGEILMGGAR